MREFRVIGPPGTGKTTWLARNVRTAAEAYGSDRVVVCSLTRTAAAEVAGRDMTIPPHNIGTLHAMAYRALGGGEVAEAKLEGFNDFAASQGEHWAKVSIDAKRDDLEDVVERSGLKDGAGDAAMNRMNCLRARMVPAERWPYDVKGFAALWNQWKLQNGLMDFTSMLEIALRDVEEAPGNPAAIFADESQDFSMLAWSLARKWGEKALTFIAVGDPDQLLYGWAGVDVEAFTHVELPKEQRRLLEQSHRVPRAVHAYAVDWIEQTPHRESVAYRPVDRDGEVSRSVATWKYPEPLIPDVLRNLDEGKSVLLCATCSYMLNPLIAVLRREGIPFHNPYRTKRGDWNPLRPGKGVGAVQRMLAFAQPSGRQGDASWWTARDFDRFVDWLTSKDVLVRGAKKRIEEWMEAEPDKLMDYPAFAAVFKEEHIEAVFERELRWFVDHTLETHRRKLTFPFRIAERFGVSKLEEEPRVIVSTIHGCKGGEADVCCVFPDLSYAAACEWTYADGHAEKEGIRRAFYVAFTRAKQELVICNPASGMCVNC